MLPLAEGGRLFDLNKDFAMLLDFDNNARDNDKKPVFLLFLAWLIRPFIYLRSLLFSSIVFGLYLITFCDFLIKTKSLRFNGDFCEPKVIFSNPTVSDTPFVENIFSFLKASASILFASFL